VSDRHQKRLNREELRTALLEAGRAILREEGFVTGLSNVTFKRSFDRVEKELGVRVTNASVIGRVWDNMTDFQADVLLSVSRDERRPEAGAMVDAIANFVEHLDVSTAESRSVALQQVCRIGGAALSAEIATSTNWSLWISVVSMANTAPEPEQRERIKAVLSEGYGTLAQFWSRQLAGLMQLLGLRLRDHLTMAQFTMAMIAFAQGCSLRQRIGDRVELIERPTGPNGELEAWTLFAMGLEALLHQFLEPDSHD